MSRALKNNFVEAPDKGGQAFNHLKEKIPKLGEAKLKEDVFVGQQIKKMLTYSTFGIKVTNIELAAWSFLKASSF